MVLDIVSDISAGSVKHQHTNPMKSNADLFLVSTAQNLMFALVFRKV